MNNNIKYYSNKLLKYIKEHNKKYFKLNILCPDVLIEPDLQTNFTASEEILKGEICNFIFLQPSEIIMENLLNLIGSIVLFQYPSKYSAHYHLRFVWIKEINKEDSTIIINSINDKSSTTNVYMEKINDLKRRNNAYRIWIPARMYIDNIDGSECETQKT